MQSQDHIRLCLASPHFYPTHGGAGLRFLRYLPGLRARGVHTRVVAGTPSERKLIGSECPEEWCSRPVGEFLPPESINGTPIYRVRLPEEKGWRRTKVFNQAVIQVATQPGYRTDVVQFLGSLPPRTFPWIVRLRLLGIPLVYAYTSPPNLPSTPFRRARRRLAYRLLHRHLDRVITLSAAMRQLVRDLGTQAKIEIIPNGVDLQRFRPVSAAGEASALRSALGIRERDTMITTVGSLIPRKGSDLLVEAWTRFAQRFPETHVVIIGPRFGPNHPVLGEFRRKVDSLVRASGASERVHFTGFVPNVEDFLRASDLFVLPSAEEGLPGVVLEAMASGVAVIATSFVGVTEELGEPGKEYLLVERNSEALAAGVVDLLKNEGRRVDLGRQGRSWVERTMDVERSIDRYAALYRKLAGQARRRGGACR
jgi:glycosyltransferase involved in cell wall biosynthesis